MSFQKKRMLLEVASSLNEAIEEIDKKLSKQVFPSSEILGDCQELAIALGDALDKREEDTEDIVHLLEEYCELVYQLSLYTGNITESRKITKKTRKLVLKIDNKIRWQLKDDKKVVVFLPYKGSMWDSLESIWMRARDDEEVEAIVIPIPYYDKNPDGSFKERHYEIDQYPDYVPVVDYREYDLETEHPDMIYIHNPYDEYNYVTSVEPSFYSSKIKDCTDCLTYVPYFVTAEIDPDNKDAVDKISHFCTVPAVFNAHRVIVQSEALRIIYINVLTEFAGKGTKGIWEEKILGTGSPKLEKIVNTKKENLIIPGEWKRIIEKPDGSWKKIVFYNTSVAALLANGEQTLRKMIDVFRVFYENRDEVALLWRPHPLIQATIESMRPELWQDYLRIVNQYKSEGWGIYDDSPDVDRAVVICDGYYGDGSSVVQLCKAVRKPVMLQDVNIVSD